MRTLASSSFCHRCFSTNLIFPFARPYSRISRQEVCYASISAAFLPAAATGIICCLDGPDSPVSESNTFKARPTRYAVKDNIIDAYIRKGHHANESYEYKIHLY